VDGRAFDDAGLNLHQLVQPTTLRQIRRVAPTPNRRAECSARESF
jgi:hypothetical protein